MAVKGYDVEIAGQGFNLAEDAEGDHFALTGEPLRPPNAVTVQGEQRNRFQIRPDILLWTLTDWSGGEGQIKYAFQSPNRWRQLTGVRVFEKPGTLQPGYYVEDTQIVSAGGDLTEPGVLAFGNQSLYHLSTLDKHYRLWNDTNKEWGAEQNFVNPTAGVTSTQCAGDGQYIFFTADTDDVYKFDGVTDTLINSGDGGTLLVAVGPYVYSFVNKPTEGKVYEIAKSGGGTTEIDSFTEEISSITFPGLVAMDGKVYVMIGTEAATIIREIVPSSAAGTGFGAEIARINGFVGQSMWGHSGTLFMFGREGLAAANSTILYITPGGEYGSLGRMRPGEALGGSVKGAGQGANMLDHFVLVRDLSANGVNEYNSVFQIDSVSGGYAALALDEDGNEGDQDLSSVLIKNEQIFWTGVDGTATRTRRAYKSGYTKESVAVSPWHDFDLADEKILSSIVMSCEALPADWTVEVEYATDGADGLSDWTATTTYTTDGGTGFTHQVSTDTTTVKFNTLSIRITMTYTGAGVPSDAPVILGIDVRAQVVKQQPVYRLLLDMDDDKSRTPGALSGARKFALLKAAADAGNVVAFKDGYTDRSQIQETDVVIDQYALLFTSPGEAVASVVLREVI